VAKVARAFTYSYPPRLAQLGDAADQLVDNAVLELAELVHVDLGRGEGNAPSRRFPRFLNQLGDVQQRLRGDAAAVQADPARLFLGVHERHFHPVIGAGERGGVPAGAGADHDNFGF